MGGGLTRYFIRLAEKGAVHKSHYLIADNPAIQQYLQQTYNKASFCIPYGADLCSELDDAAVLSSYQVEKFDYFLLIARLEPENTIEEILNGYCASEATSPLLVVGGYHHRYGRWLRQKFRHHSNIRFLGGIYDIGVLNVLRHFSRLYFHGHSVGGTNPSLLEAMAAGALIAAHNNPFNRAVLADAVYFFESAAEVTSLIQTVARHDTQRTLKIESNYDKIRE